MLMPSTIPTSTWMWIKKGGIVIGEFLGSLLSNPWWLFLVAVGIPPLITHQLEKEIDRREAIRLSIEEERTKQRAKLELILIQSISASLALGEATARAVQRIPDAHCNEDMRSALEYVSKVKKNQKTFLTELGISSLFDHQN